MGRKLFSALFALVLVLTFFLGAISVYEIYVIKEVPIYIEKEVIREVPIYIEKEVIREVPIYIEKEVIKEVPSFELKQFATQAALSWWQACNYIGDQKGWNCVDYALELQRRALLDGYQMSTETLIDKGGRTGHMICSTVIGSEIIFLDPQNTISWVGGMKAGAKLEYRPLYWVYSPDGKLLRKVYREE